MRSDPAVILLVTRARGGDKAAWDELVGRYAPLVWTICRRFRLAPEDIDDVGQSVWLRLVEHLPQLREPAALPGWIATTTQRECGHLIRMARRTEPVDPLDPPHDLADDTVPVDEEVLMHERREAARAAFDHLQPRCRVLLTLLTQDPPVPYSEIARSLHMPVGSIGPNRARCLDRLRQAPALAALIDGFEHENEGTAGEHDGRSVVDR
jgi:RNA polymerase sigma factor (sigma-70 family)